MDGMLKSGTIMVSESRNRYKVIKLLGSGGQGEVYEVTGDNDRFALKWYFPKTATTRQKGILEKLLIKGSPSPAFLWPEDIITNGKSGSLGYIMKLRPKGFYSIDDLMNRKAEPTFEMLCRAAFNLTLGFQKLHKQGYSYHDISFGNVFFNPENGSILICDNDNVTVSGDNISTIRGTPRFMAPEIVIGEAKPSRNTDLYSLAVLIFYMLMLHHPLEGKQEADIKCLDIFAMTKIYGKNPIFIFDPVDDSNRPVPGYQNYPITYWQIYPQFIKDLFIKSFTTGLFETNRRVTEKQWLDGISALMFQIIPCLSCKAEVFYSVGKCWACGSEIPKPSLLKVDKRLVALYPKLKIYSHLINDDYDLNTVIAMVVRNPKNPDLLGIRNDTNQSWDYTKKDGETVPLAPGKSAAIKQGARFDFGNKFGEII